tara:strand:+ start:5133 stop:6839 length:1707 start_codon:yes stop_codon:yes gene_type:complete
MFLRLIILGLSSLSTLLIASPVKKNKQWDKIIFADKGTLRSQVSNSEYFLGNSNSIIDEYNVFKTTFNTNETLNKEYACAFPARFSLYKEMNPNIANIHLEECLELNSFLDALPGNKISIGLASEHLSSPSSSFGHLMLILHNQDELKLDDLVIHFAAKTDKRDGFLSYAFKGLTGGYPSYFIIEPFYNKLHEYVDKEQRTLYVNEITISPKELKLLKYMLFELNRAEFPYYFLNLNCAHRVDELLSAAIDKDVRRNLIYTLPIDVFRKHQDLKNKAYMLKPSSMQAIESYKLLSNKDKLKFRSVTESSSRLDASSSSELKKTLFFYNQYKFKALGYKIQNYADNLSKSKSFPATQNETDLSSNDISNDTTQTLTLKYFYDTRTANGVLLEYLPVYNQISAFQRNKQFESEFKVFHVSLLYTKNNDLSLNYLDLLSLQFFPPFNAIQSDLSWQFISRLQDDKKYYMEYGLGQTFGSSVLINYLVNIGLRSNLKRTRLFFSPELNLFTYPSARLKLGVNLKHLVHRASTSVKLKVFTHLLITSNKSLVFDYSSEEDNAHKFGLGVRLSF